MDTEKWKAKGEDWWMLKYAIIAIQRHSIRPTQHRGGYGRLNDSGCKWFPRYLQPAAALCLAEEYMASGSFSGMEEKEPEIISQEMNVS